MPDDPHLPLAGIRVLELASVIAGPYAGSLLRNLGAEIVKVEPLQGGDPIRLWTSPRGPAVFNQINAGKQSIAVNLSSPKGQEVVRELLPTFDVLVHNLRPQRAEELGLTGRDCLSVHPPLVYVALSGFGGVGPLGDRPGYDGIGQAFGGLTGLITPLGDRPRIGPAFADLTAGLVCMAAVLIGLFARERSGEGQIIETSLIEAVVALIADQFAHQQASGAAQDFDRRARRSQIFSLGTKDDRFVLVHVSTSEKFFRSMLVAFGREELATDHRFDAYEKRVDNYDELLAEIEMTSRQEMLAHWESALASADVPFSPVLTIDDVLSHPQFDALQLFSAIEKHSGIKLTGVPWRFDGVRPAESMSAPLLGEHTEAVLSDVLSHQEVERLREEGVIGGDR